MLKSSVNIHSWAYFISLILVAVSLPLSKFAMSIAQFILLTLWLWSGFSFKIAYRFFKVGGFFRGVFHLIGYLARLLYRNLGDKFALFFKNKAAVVFTSIYFLHVAGFLYSSDIEYALKDLRIKLPILLFPVVISTMETIKYKRFRPLMLLYIAAVAAGTLISFGLILKGEFTDIRYTSPYISSIRFGLNVSFAFFALVYFVFLDDWFKKWQKIVLGLFALWFFIYLILLESVTSLGVILLIIMLFLVFQIFNLRSRAIKLTFIILLVIIPLGLTFYVLNTIDKATTAPELSVDKIELLTKSGNPYKHDTIKRGIEDGRYLGLYICEAELEKAWNVRSEIDYRSYPDGQHELRETLIRYLTSKDLRKDKEGIESLSNKDIRLIEQGVANYNYVHNPGLRVRILKILMGYEVYKKTGDPSGSSVMQRIEYSKASLSLIKKHFWFGVGTGDIEYSLIEQYELMKSGLGEQYMFHAHNQFFAIFITFGVFGFIWFLIALIYPPFHLGRFSDYFFVTFFLIIIWSMLSDDTMETQAGVTLFAFFFSFLLFGKEKKNAGN